MPIIGRSRSETRGEGPLRPGPDEGTSREQRMPETDAENKYVGARGRQPAPRLSKSSSEPDIVKGLEPAVWTGKGEVSTDVLNDVLKKASTARQSLMNVGAIPVKKASESMKSLDIEAPDGLLRRFNVPPSLAVARRVNGRSFFEVEVIPSFI